MNFDGFSSNETDTPTGATNSLTITNQLKQEIQHLNKYLQTIQTNRKSLQQDVDQIHEEIEYIQESIKIYKSSTIMPGHTKESQARELQTLEMDLNYRFRELRMCQKESERYDHYEKHIITKIKNILKQIQQ